MKIFGAFLICFLFVFNSFGSPLIFKAAKTVNSKEFVDLAVFDASRYQSIRVLIASPDYKPGIYDKPQMLNMIQATTKQNKYYEDLMRNTSLPKAQLDSYQQLMDDSKKYLEKLQKQ